MYNEGDRRGLFYAQSWALVHYLTFGGPQRAAQLKAYLSAIGAGMPPPDAFVQAFGADTGALARSLTEYIQRSSFTALRIELDEKLERPATSPAEAIADDEAAGYLGDMMSRLNRTDDARAYLRKTIDGGARRRPGDRGPWPDRTAREQRGPVGGFARAGRFACARTARLFRAPTAARSRGVRIAEGLTKMRCTVRRGAC